MIPHKVTGTVVTKEQEQPFHTQSELLHLLALLGGESHREVPRQE